MGLVLVTTDAKEPVSLVAAKRHLKVEFTDDDDLIDTCIAAAREYGETHNGRRFVTSTFDWTLDGFPRSGGGVLYVPRPPLQSVTSIAYVDAEGVSQTLSASKYTVDTSSQPGRIEPAYNEVWPIARAVPNAVTITFVAGYGAPAAVPATIKQAMLLKIGDLYEHRMGQSELRLQHNEAVDSLLNATRMLSAQ